MPLAIPRGAEAAAAAAAAAAFVATPTVGATVAIKWDPTQWAMDKGGWCTGVVKVISDGKAPAPPMQGRKRSCRDIVTAGYSIVDYGEGGRYVHLLDQAHHVSIWGDKVDAWRLLSSPGDADSGAGGETNQLGGQVPNNPPCLEAGAGGNSLVNETGVQSGGRGGHGPAQGAGDDDDDVPLFPNVCSAVLLAGTVLRKGLEMGLLLITVYLQQLHLNVSSELPVGMLPVG